ncbi:MAG: hypothetical protein AAGA33_05195 [Pseudomonadota bacterium]
MSVQPLVLSRTPLLPAEIGNTAWSERALRVPVASAWSCVSLDLCLLMPVCDTRINAAVEARLERADQRHHGCRWPSAALREDSYRNRRIALEVTGVADYMLEAGASLSAMHRLIGAISARARHWTARISTAPWPLPAIADSDPGRHLPDGELRQRFRERWRAAVIDSAVRHRNLTALSPWSLVYRRDGRLHCELLSLLVHADAIYWKPPPLFTPLTPAQVSVFRQCLAAAIQQRQALDQIAKPA